MSLSIRRKTPRQKFHQASTVVALKYDQGYLELSQVEGAPQGHSLSRQIDSYAGIEYAFCCSWKTMAPSGVKLN